MAVDREKLKQEILEKVREYHALAHTPAAFEPGKSRVTYAGRYYDQKELVNLVDASLDFWLTAGPYSNRFEGAMRRRFKASAFFFVNSGSSANLLMVSTLCSPDLERYLEPGDPRPLVPGDEVITPAVTFPTTLSPIVQNRLVPVFVDVELGTYNIDPARIEGAIGPRTRALFIPHTLGNPADLDVLSDVAKRHNLWLLEDGCDALGAEWRGKAVGTFGAMSSISFYPCAPYHHRRRRRHRRQPLAVAPDRPFNARLGARLLVRSRQKQYLQKALRLAARRTAARLRSQIYLFEHRLQSEGDGSASRILVV